MSIAGYLTRTVWKHRVGALSSVLCGMLLFLLWFWLGPIDQRIETVAREGQTLLFLNRFGHTVTHLENVDNPWGNYIETYRESGRTYSMLQSEAAGTILCGLEHPAVGYFLECKSGIRPLFRRKLDISRNANYVRQPWGRGGRRLLPIVVQLAPANSRGGFNGVFGGFEEQTAHGFIQRFDVNSGAPLSEYTHPGRINGIVSVKLTDDKWYYVVYGVTNAFGRRSFIALLDPEFVEGHGPSPPAFELVPSVPGKEVVYMVLPLTRLGKLFDQNQQSQEADFDSLITVGQQAAPRLPHRTMQEGTELIVSTTELIHSQNPVFSPEERNVVSTLRNRKDYTMILDAVLDNRFRIKRFEVNDVYLRTLQESISNGWLDSIYAEVEMDVSVLRGVVESELRILAEHEIRYWDGDGWKKHPVFNKHYLEASGRSPEEILPGFLQSDS